MRLILIAAFGLLSLASCRQAATESLNAAYDRLDRVPRDRWEALAHKKVFFGHKSVGANIVDGLKDVLARRPDIALDIRETLDPAAFSGPVFAHSPIGTNKNPLSKIARFREVLESGVGEAADMAFFKFCFIDFDHETDIQAIFDRYVELIDGLRARFPRLRIVTFTVPLLSKPVGIKDRLRKLLGRMPWHEEDNAQRNRFNEMLRARFRGSLFDLAAVESRIDDTKKATFRKDGRAYDMLYRGYTDDGGHLNPAGRQIVAIELLTVLADLPVPTP